MGPPWNTLGPWGVAEQEKTTRGPPLRPGREVNQSNPDHCPSSTERDLGTARLNVGGCACRNGGWFVSSCRKGTTRIETSRGDRVLAPCRDVTGWLLIVSYNNSAGDDTDGSTTTTRRSGLLGWRCSSGTTMLIGRTVLGTEDWVRFVLSYGATVRHQPDGLGAAVLALTARTS